jgi:hypothetical protein
MGTGFNMTLAINYGKESNSQRKKEDFKIKVFNDIRGTHRNLSLTMPMNNGEAFSIASLLCSMELDMGKVIEITTVRNVL